jgi:hypothetical protein
MINKTISNYNSHYNILKSNEIFTGVIENITQYKNITIAVDSNVDSIPNGIEIYFGSNYTNMVKTDTFTFSTKKDKIFNVDCKNKLFYIVYRNGANPTKFFNMEVSYNGSNDNMEMVLHNTFMKQISINNSSDKLLGMNESFEGNIDSIELYRSIIIIIHSDVSGILNIYSGQTKDNMINTNTFNYNAEGQKIITLNCYNFFFKIKYINNNINQSIFNISVIYEPLSYLQTIAEPSKIEQNQNYNCAHNDLSTQLLPILNTINDNIIETNNIHQQIANEISIKNTNTTTELKNIYNEIININNTAELKNIYNEIIHTNNIFKNKLDEIKTVIDKYNIYDTSKKIDTHIQNISHKLDLLNNMTEDKLNDICKQKNILTDINNSIIKNSDKLSQIINNLSVTYEEDANSNMILSDIHIEQKEIVKSINNLINVNNDLLDVYKNLTDRIN